jgi:hypothetical protein
MRFEFSGELIEWRGPSPFHFVRIPEAESSEIRALAPLVTYGWGAVPVRIRIGRSEVDTALIPKNGGYLVPVKDRLRAEERLALGDIVTMELAIRSDRLGT